MFFVLSKILGFLAIPSNLVALAGLAGMALLLTRYARAGRRLVVASLVLIAVLGLSPIGNALIIPLEQRFPPWNPSGESPAGFVILGGAISPDISTARNTVALIESAERVAVVAELARRYPDAKILFSGGSGALLYGEGIEAEFALRLLQSFGITRERILLEFAVAQYCRERAVFQGNRPTEGW